MTLSIVVIAKNAFRAIKNVVANGLRVADEVVVVDTGSRDGTQERARCAGAVVVPCELELFEFSIPRNVGLRVANGDYVLMLDTDESIDDRFALVMHEAMRRGHYDLFYVLQQGLSPSGRPTEYHRYQPRLMKRDRYAWTGVVWETVAPLRDFGIVDVCITHYVSSPETTRLKWAERVEMAEREARMLIGRPIGRDLECIIQTIHRAVQLASAGIARDELVCLARRAYTAGLQVDPEDSWLAVVMSTLLRSIGDPTAAEQILARVPTRRASHHRYWHELSLVLAQCGNIDGAVAAVRRAGVLEPCALYWNMLGVLLWSAGRRREGSDCLRVAFERLPEDPSTSDFVARMSSARPMFAPG